MCFFGNRNTSHLRLWKACRKLTSLLYRCRHISDLLLRHTDLNVPWSLCLGLKLRSTLIQRHFQDFHQGENRISERSVWSLSWPSVTLILLGVLFPAQYGYCGSHRCCWHGHDYSFGSFWKSRQSLNKMLLYNFFHVTQIITRHFKETQFV